MATEPPAPSIEDVIACREAIDKQIASSAIAGEMFMCFDTGTDNDAACANLLNALQTALSISGKCLFAIRNGDPLCYTGEDGTMKEVWNKRNRKYLLMFK